MASNASSQRKRSPRIVVIGGGSGTSAVLEGLRPTPAFVTAIISMADDGGSTGILRREFGVPAPGDVRKALLALSDGASPHLRELWNYRFDENGLAGHNLGNLMLVALARSAGNFEKGLRQAHELLHVRGAVVPVTLDSATLIAEFENGSRVRGETHIDIPTERDGSLPIRRVWLEPEVQANPAALQAIREADLIVLGPGDWYTSVIPNLLVRGIPEAIRTSRAKKVLIANFCTKWGETHGFTIADFARTATQYLGAETLDCIVMNSARPNPLRWREVANSRGSYVELGNYAGHALLIQKPLLTSRGPLRHDPERLAAVLFEILNRKWNPSR